MVSRAPGEHASRELEELYEENGSVLGAEEALSAPNEGDRVTATELVAAGAGDADAAAEPEPAGPFLHRSVTVEVPATTANLGAGYDALAMALDLVNRVTVELLERPGVELTVEGEGAGTLVGDGHNRFVVALETGVRWALGERPEGIGWRVTMKNAIPLARGLGSSAAATVAGLVAADAFTEKLDDRRLLALACEIEGHPDNAAAALLGGFVVVTMVEGRPEAIRFDVPRALRAVVFIPQRSLATSAMRASLPHGVPHRDAVFNVGRAALTVAGIASGHYEVLRAGTEDRLHEPYRAAAYPELPHLVRAARDAGALGACLSGAGSSVIAFGDSMSRLADIQQAFAGAAADQEISGAIEILAPRNAGAFVVEAR
jgi:homoserine kinase